MGENCAIGADLGFEDGLSRLIAEARPPPPQAGARKKGSRRTSMEEEDFLNLLHGSDPVKIELNRLENEVRDKERELAEAQCEIKALKLTERAKEKAVAEVTEELEKIFQKFQASEVALENKNLEIKKITEEKKAALAAQFAAEATLRRVHAAQKDEELPPIEAILFPLEAEIKLLRQEVSKLQDDNRALDRLTKSKETALLEAEREVQVAKVKAALVDELLNRNQELVKQNEICQEEYKILDRMHRQKVAEVEKMGQTIHELEEALLSGAVTANAVRDYQRQVNELKGEKKTLERTLSRVKVTENRAAAVLANEWKDVNEMMPVKQWLEERRALMGEMQQLRDKLSVAERATKAEAQLKEKFQIRLKIIEESLKASISCCNGGGSPRCSSLNRNLSIPLSNGNHSKKTMPPLLRSSSMSRNSTMMRHMKSASRSFDGGRASNEDQYRNESSQDKFCNKSVGDECDGLCGNDASQSPKMEAINGKPTGSAVSEGDDYVPSILYDILQKEVIALRKACHEKDQGLQDKESSIEMLSRKVDTLIKAMEVESKKMQREKAAMAKEITSLRAETENVLKGRRSKGIMNSPHN